MILYVARVKYKIGAEILMPKRNLHNTTLRGRTETTLSRIYTVSYALYDQVGPRAVGATKKKREIFFGFAS